MLAKFGYIDRRDQSKLAPEDRLRPLPGPVSSDLTPKGHPDLPDGLRRYSIASYGPETLRQAQTWETVKQSYLSDGFCERCSTLAAYGHQIGFKSIPPVCLQCLGRAPSWRRAGDEAGRWAGETPLASGRQQNGSQGLLRAA